MSDIESIITELERQRTAIDKALEALRGVTGGSTIARRGRPRGARRGTSEDGRQRQIEAMRAYWAAKKAGGKQAAPRNAAKKRALTAAGRKALSENMKRLWAKKRAGSKR